MEDTHTHDASPCAGCSKKSEVRPCQTRRTWNVFLYLAHATAVCGWSVVRPRERRGPRTRLVNKCPPPLDEVPGFIIPLRGPFFSFFFYFATLPASAACPCCREHSPERFRSAEGVLIDLLVPLRSLGSFVFFSIECRKKKGSTPSSTNDSSSACSVPVPHAPQLLPSKVLYKKQRPLWYIQFCGRNTSQPTRRIQRRPYSSPQLRYMILLILLKTLNCYAVCRRSLDSPPHSSTTARPAVSLVSCLKQTSRGKRKHLIKTLKLAAPAVFCFACSVARCGARRPR